jgi:diaminohydroxyphosphoribosylaminopyrimidine deaminase / 5-amino-6-(5-phosphoribosylamino)uracil reductase
VSDAASDRRFMALAIALGRRGLGQVWPNPAVGCVIVREGRIIGRGWTQRGGRPHAETIALAQAGAAAEGATAYVSLEPCAHHGRTPPCAEALVAARVGRVVTALEDPDPRVRGAGHKLLINREISLTTGVLEAEARAANAGFLSRIERGRPWLTLKLALSLDGRIATATGESRWITGPEARRLVHALRHSHDAVLVGGGTARSDDPALTVRDMGPVHQPVRIVASRRLDLPRDGTLARTIPDAPLWLLHDPDAAAPADRTAWEAAGARLVPCASGPDGQLDPASLLGVLGEAGLTRVFCEGGGTFAAALLAAGLVDEIAVFSAGLAIGAEGRPGLAALGLDRLADARRFRLVSVERTGGDVLHRWQAG